MPRINPVKVEDAKGEVKEIYQNLEKNMGKVLNIFQIMGNSPVVLKAFLDLNEAAGRTSISPKLREEIALLVGQSNQCQYCLSAHSTIAKSVGLNDTDIIKARKGLSSDPKQEAILKFVKAVVENRGHVSNQEVTTLKTANVSDTEILDIILVIMVNMFTNYHNSITDPKIDFPIAPEEI